MTSLNQKSPWRWIPSLYFAEGLPYIIVMSLSVIMYKRLGISNTDIALYTSWLYLPWVIKPFWSPIVDRLATKRHWIVISQILIGAGLGGVAFTIQMDAFFQYSLAIFWLLAFSSATHDIAADGYYMLALSKHDQAWFVGIRSTFYRFAVIAGQGLLIMLAGYIESETGLETNTIEITSSVSQPKSATPFTSNSRTLSQADIMLSSQSQVLNPIALEPAQNKATITAAKQWNQSKGFVPQQAQPTPNTAQNNDAIATKNMLESFIVKWFALSSQSDTSVTSAAGNIGLSYIKLKSAPKPNQTISLTISHSGDKSIKLITSERLVFNENNWQSPAAVIVQLDPNLKLDSTAILTLRAGDIPFAWSLTLFVAAALFLVLFGYHAVALPQPEQKSNLETTEQQTFAAVILEMASVFISFFQKPHMLSILAFLLFYRFSEAQLVKLAAPFLLDAEQVGGLQLSTGEVGFIYGTIGVLALTIGGLCGGFLAAKHGLKRWLLPMAIAINIPNVAYLILSQTMPDNLMAINVAVAAEQFGYGFGFTAYMLFMIYIAEGEHSTAHFAIGTGFMALGMMIPGMFSGWLQDLIGYQSFFVWVLIATIPSLLATLFIKVDPEFGKQT